MSHKKGQFVEYAFPKRPVTTIKASKVMRDPHRAVILHKRETPYKLILIAPITTASSLESQGKIPLNYVRLGKGKYPFALTEDCYICLDNITVADEVELKQLTTPSNVPIQCVLDEFDLIQLDYKMVLTHELGKYLQTEIANEIESVIEYIKGSLSQRKIELLERAKTEKPEVLILEAFNYFDSLLDDVRAEFIEESDIYTIPLQNIKNPTP